MSSIIKILLKSVRPQTIFFFGHAASWIPFLELGIFTEGEIILDGFSNKLHFSGKMC